MTTVGLLGTIHNAELRERYNCSLSLYKRIIHEFKPDVICGEVHPQSWQKYMNDPQDKGYWGEPASEYWELIFPLCEEHRIIFVPIDWFELDVWHDFDPFIGYGAEERKKLEQQDDAWFIKQMETSSYGNIPFNSNEFDQITRMKYEWLSKVSPKSQNMRWQVRNQIMIQRVKNAMKEYAGKRILCIVGADHNYIFQDELRKEDVHWIYPLKLKENE
ncbi:hypothetical protein [Paenibacillus sp. FSL K6-1558]|uniref:hypothetical protein n=1 Tax=Paenibacillus sp. FSL K6-1558 TaxID=2921473 RepID=UPI0012B8C247|nr:hypothetical protein [Paenibacillus xylanexedens]